MHRELCEYILYKHFFSGPTCRRGKYVIKRGTPEILGNKICTCDRNFYPRAYCAPLVPKSPKLRKLITERCVATLEEQAAKFPKSKGKGLGPGFGKGRGSRSSDSASSSTSKSSSSAKSSSVKSGSSAKSSTVKSGSSAKSSSVTGDTEIAF